MLRSPLGRQSATEESGTRDIAPCRAVGSQTATAQTGLARAGLARSVRLFRLFLKEHTEPDLFYSGQAADAVSQLARYTELAGRTVVDVGGGAGYFTAAFRAAGADSFFFEPDQGEMMS